MGLAQARGIGAASDIDAIPLGRLGNAEGIAGTVQYLVTDLSAYLTAQCICVCGGKALTPS